MQPSQRFKPRANGRARKPNEGVWATLSSLQRRQGRLEAAAGLGEQHCPHDKKRGLGDLPRSPLAQLKPARTLGPRSAKAAEWVQGLSRGGWGNSPIFNHSVFHSRPSQSPTLRPPLLTKTTPNVLKRCSKPPRSNFQAHDRPNRQPGLAPINRAAMRDRKTAPSPLAAAAQLATQRILKCISAAVASPRRLAAAWLLRFVLVTSSWVTLPPSGRPPSSLPALPALAPPLGRNQWHSRLRNRAGRHNPRRLHRAFGVGAIAIAALVDRVDSVRG
jgi:hypothetical protein